MSSLTIDVVSAENEIYSGEATFVSLQANKEIWVFIPIMLH